MESENETSIEGRKNVNVFTSEHIRKLSKFRRSSIRLQGNRDHLQTVCEQEHENVSPNPNGAETRSSQTGKFDFNRRRSGLVKQNIYENLSELPTHTSNNHARSRRSSLLLKQGDSLSELPTHTNNYARLYRRSISLQKQDDEGNPSDHNEASTHKNAVAAKMPELEYNSSDSSSILSRSVAPASQGFITRRRSDLIFENKFTDDEKMAIEASLQDQSEDVTMRLNSLRRRSELGDMFDNIKSKHSNQIELEPKINYMTSHKRTSNITRYNKEEIKVFKENYKDPYNALNTPDQNKMYTQYNAENVSNEKCSIPSVHIDIATCEKPKHENYDKRNHFYEDDSGTTSSSGTRNTMMKKNFPEWFNPHNSHGKINENDKTNSMYSSQNNDTNLNDYQTEMRTPVSNNKTHIETQRSSTKLSSKGMTKKNFPEWYKPQNSYGKKYLTKETNLTDLCQLSDISPAKNERERKRKALQAIAPIVEADRERRRSQMIQKSSSKKPTPEGIANSRTVELLKSNIKKFASPSCRSPGRANSLIKTPLMLKKSNLSVDFQECRRALEFVQEKDKHDRLLPPGTPLQPITPQLEKISGPLFQGTKITINKAPKAVTNNVISNSSIEEQKSVESLNTFRPLKRKSLQNRNLQSKQNQPLVLAKPLQAFPKDMICSSLENSKSLKSQNIVKPQIRRSLQNRNLSTKLKQPLYQTNRFKYSTTLNIEKGDTSNKQEDTNKQRIKSKILTRRRSSVIVPPLIQTRRRSSIIVPPLKSSKKKRKSIGVTKLPQRNFGPMESSTTMNIPDSDIETIQDNDNNSPDGVTNVLESNISNAVLPEIVCRDASTSTSLQWNDGSTMDIDTTLMGQVAQLEAEHKRIMNAAQTLVEQTAERRERMREHGMLSKFSESISPLKRLRSILYSNPSCVAIVEQLCQEETMIPSNGDEALEKISTNADNSEIMMHTPVVQEEVTPNNKSVRFNQTEEIHEHSDMDITCSPSSGDNSFVHNETSLNASGMDMVAVNNLNNSQHHMECLKSANKFLKTPATQRVKPFKKPNSFDHIGPQTAPQMGPVMGPPPALNVEIFTDGSTSPFSDLVGDCERPSIAPLMTPHSRKDVSVLKDALNRQLADLFD